MKKRLTRFTLACLLLDRLRTWGLAKAEMVQATVGTVRLKLLKIAPRPSPLESR